MLNDSDYSDLLAKAEAATPGPWEVQDRPTTPGRVWSIGEPGDGPADEDGDLICEIRGGPNWRHDTAYIAAASPDVIRALVLRLRAAERTIAAYFDITEGGE